MRVAPCRVLAHYSLRCRPSAEPTLTTCPVLRCLNSERFPNRRARRTPRIGVIRTLIDVEHHALRSARTTSQMRRRIEGVLSGHVPLPGGIPARWQLHANSPADVSAAETALAEQLIRSSPSQFVVDAAGLVHRSNVARRFPLMRRFSRYRRCLSTSGGGAVSGVSSRQRTAQPPSLGRSSKRI
jgi:hypothetical protein